MAKIIYTSSEEFISIAMHNLLKVESILDIGTGIVPHESYVESEFYISCEPYEEYFKVLTSNLSNRLDRIYINRQYDWEKTNEKFNSGSVDTVFLIDVIEHLEKDYGRKLLEETIQLARRQVVIFTPLSYIEQKEINGKDAWGLSGGSWQEHKSVWTPSDFNDEWICIVCKDYHKTNNIGEVLEVPVGAFWAIKNIKDDMYDEINKFYYDMKNYPELICKFKEYMRNSKSAMQNLKNIIEFKEKELKFLTEEISIQNKTLDEIYSSKGWKLLEKYRKIKRKLKGK